MSNVAVFWMCRACKEDRPEAWISVAKRRIVVDRGEPIELTACYCNDRPRCFQDMPLILEAMARPIIDELIAPRVHLLWHGFPVCDLHKRWPEDFPKGTKWIALTDKLLLDEVTCELCLERGRELAPGEARRIE